MTRVIYTRTDLVLFSFTSGNIINAKPLLDFFFFFFFFLSLFSFFLILLRRICLLSYYSYCYIFAEQKINNHLKRSRSFFFFFYLVKYLQGTESFLFSKYTLWIFSKTTPLLFFVYLSIFFLFFFFLFQIKGGVVKFSNHHFHIFFVSPSQV